MRTVSWVPAAAPAGRALVNFPVAYTVLPTTTCDQTTPLICTVGSASAVTVAGVAGFLGSSGAESAWAVAGPRRPSAPPANSRLNPPAMHRLATPAMRPVTAVPRFDPSPGTPVIPGSRPTLSVTITAREG